jgi:hypothetical protein
MTLLLRYILRSVLAFLARMPSSAVPNVLATGNRLAAPEEVQQRGPAQILPTKSFASVLHVRLSFSTKSVFDYIGWFGFGLS